jgi:hypothetical protein
MARSDCVKTKVFSQKKIIQPTDLISRKHERTRAVSRNLVDPPMDLHMHTDWKLPLVQPQCKARAVPPEVPERAERLSLVVDADISVKKASVAGKGERRNLNRVMVVMVVVVMVVVVVISSVLPQSAKSTQYKRGASAAAANKHTPGVPSWMAQFLQSRHCPAALAR